MSQRTYLWLGLIFLGLAIIIWITFVGPRDLLTGYYGEIYARLIFECAVLIVLIGIVGFIYSAIKTKKFPKIPTDKNGEVDVDNPKTKEAIEKWAKAFRGLIYCEVMTYYDSVDEWGEDQAGSFVLWITYFTSTEVYELSKEVDLFCGWLESYRSKEGFAGVNKEDLHQIQISFTAVKDLPKIYKKVENEIYKFTVKSSADKPN